jgi:uncharacterized protein YndB with AHSA1/START domain
MIEGDEYRCIRPASPDAANGGFYAAGWLLWQTTRTVERPMTQLPLTITIDRPIADVFRVLTTPEDTPKWSSSAVEEALTSPGPVGIGSTRRAVVRSFGGRTTTNETVVTEFEPNRKVAMRTTSAPVPFGASWSFSGVPGGTRVDWSWSFEFTGALRLLAPAFGSYFRRSLQKDLDRLKLMMEAGEL